MPENGKKSNGVRIPELITKKRDGKELTQEDVENFIQGILKGDVQDSQMGAMLMAMFLKGMNEKETIHMTKSMIKSGDSLEWPEEWKGLVVDKHSTGGVGDKVSLPLAPALAACGLKVPMISGRGLGFTGGTLDKLESIPGFQVAQSAEDMTNILQRVGCCIVGQTEKLVPADRILYANRDVTGTVESMPLIAASIISKKAVENLDALVLDVKFGKAAFMKTEIQARKLANCLVSVSEGLGVKTVALLTRMDHPIGSNVGNALEIIECLDCLHGKGPQTLTELVTKLGGHLLKSVGKVTSAEEGASEILARLQDGSALEKFREMMEAQGVDGATAAKLCDGSTDLFQMLRPATHNTDLKCSSSGYVHSIDALTCAHVSGGLGAGRNKAGESVDHAVGIQLFVKVGDYIEKGTKWVRVHHNQELPDSSVEYLQRALVVQPEPVHMDHLSLVADVITS